MIENASQLALFSLTTVSTLSQTVAETDRTSYATNAYYDSTRFELTEEQKRIVSEIPLQADTEMPLMLEIDEYVSIQLTERPSGVLRNYSEIYIKGWNISLPPEDFDFATTKREMTRQFLRLQRDVRADSLTEKDRKTWSFIVDHINYAQYCDDTALPIDFQGILKSRKNGCVSVSWVNDEQNYLEGKLADRLSLINEGESFVCRVKFRDSKIVALYDVTPVSSSSQLDLSWIQTLK